jgi:hypothetical protein
MDSYNAVMCSYRVFEEVLNLSKQTITRSIKILKDNGFIAIYKSGTSNVYIVNDNLAWSSWGNNKKYCKFPTNVILSYSENERLNEIKPVKLKQVTINHL